MIIGDYARCTTDNCSQEYRIRLHFGNSYPQIGIFKCKICGVDLKYGRDKDRNVVFEGLEIISESSSPIIQNIHSELPIDTIKVNDPFYFPSLDFLMQVNLSDKLEYSKFRNEQKRMANLKGDLDKIILDLKFLKEERWLMLEKKYGKNHIKIEKSVLKNVMAIGRTFISGKWWEYYRKGLSTVELAKRHTNFSALKQFLSHEKKQLLIEKLLTILQIYNVHYNELLPTLISQKLSIPVTGSSSVENWENMQFIYGSFYEILGDLMLIPTCVNNLLTRGDFNQFNTIGFNIQNYITSDKANRSKNFSVNTSLSWISDFYEPDVRNATYHKNSRTTNNDQQIELKVGKGGSRLKTISLIEYIEHCNELFARCVILNSYLYKIIY